MIVVVIFDGQSRFRRLWDGRKERSRERQRGREEEGVLIGEDGTRNSVHNSFVSADSRFVLECQSTMLTLERHGVVTVEAALRRAESDSEFNSLSRHVVVCE